MSQLQQRYQDMVNAAAAYESCEQACENCNCDSQKVTLDAAIIALGEEINPGFQARPIAEQTKIITSFFPFFFDFRVNRALRRGWKVQSIGSHRGFLGRLVLVVILGK